MEENVVPKTTFEHKRKILFEFKEREVPKVHGPWARAEDGRGHSTLYFIEEGRDRIALSNLPIIE